MTHQPLLPTLFQSFLHRTAYPSLIPRLSIKHLLILYPPNHILPRPPSHVRQPPSTRAHPGESRRPGSSGQYQCVKASVSGQWEHGTTRQGDEGYSFQSNSWQLWLVSPTVSKTPRTLLLLLLLLVLTLCGSERPR